MSGDSPHPASLPAGAGAVSWVVLTQGDRPEELACALASIAAQDGPPAQVIVVSNGAGPIDVPAEVDVVVLPDNVGIPEGRNRGWSRATGDVVFFLDDDAEIAGRRLVSETLYLFATEPGLGIVSFRLVDPVGGGTERRHVPRLRADEPERSSRVTTFLGGACAVRRRVLRDVGGYPGDFFYSMEESDLAWRALDSGWQILYLGATEVRHPASRPSRHPDSAHRTARNRVWLARRRLPMPAAALYLTTWTVLTVARAASVDEVRAAASGFCEGWRSHPGERRPIRWSTVARMTALGRPPII